MAGNRSPPNAPPIHPIVVSTVAALMPTACAYKGLGTPVVTAVVLHGEGVLSTPTPSATADTYNPALAPIGARLTANMNPSGETANVALAVSGMLLKWGRITSTA